MRNIACGLAALGLARGQNLAFVSDNRPNVYMGFAAVQSLGAVPIPLYQDAVAQEMAFVMEDADIHFAFAEDQEQVDKLLEVRETVPSITHIIYDDPRGLRKYEEPGLISTAELKKLGAAWDKDHPGVWDSMQQRVQAEDVAVILYTSGTTGKPKGVCLTHTNFIGSAQPGGRLEITFSQATSLSTSTPPSAEPMTLACVRHTPMGSLVVPAGS